MKKKLLLINCVDFNNYPEKENYNPLPVITAYEPIHLGIIATLTPDDWDVELIDENFEIFSYKSADLVALSSYTTSINRAYYLSSLYKAQNTPVIIGGVHASFFPEEVAQYADVVAVGKAEGFWSDIISDFNNKTLKTMYRSDGDTKLCYTPKRSLYEKYKYPIATVIASMGCPYRCVFCDIPIINKTYYLRDVDEIIAELKQVKQKFFIFNDDNFIGNTKEHKNRVVELLEKMITSKIDKKWMCVTSINISEYPDVLKLAKKAGCVMMFMGIESFKTEDLSKFNKAFSKKHAENSFRKAFKIIHNNKIAVTGGFLCGLDDDTLEDIERKKDEIIKSKVNSFTYTFYTPLPKTKIYKDFEYEKRLLYTNYPQDWIYHNLSCVTFNPKLDTHNAYYKAYMKAVIDLHSTKVFMNKFYATILQLRSISRAVDVYFILSKFHNNVERIRFFSKIFRIFKYN